MQWLFIAHRYLGMALGVLMAMWCLSGVVMIYVPYPELAESERLTALAPIDWTHCCTVPQARLADAEPVGRFSVEMLAGHPVLWLPRVPGPSQLIDLTDGRAIEHVSPVQATSVAAEYAQAHGYWDPPAYGDAIDYDQWTVSGSFDADRPLYRFRIDDTAQTELYVSSSSGRIVQATTARERLWNWLGAIPHWLYFAELRRNVAAWSRVVIYTSLAGCFLALIGIYIGVRQFLRRPAGRWSGYRGILLWHHVPGLIFGLFALTWVASGLISMNPWGFLEGGGARSERRVLLGESPSGAELRAALQALTRANTRPGTAPPERFVSVAPAPLLGHLYLIATGQRGDRRRLDAMGSDTPITPGELTHAARAIARGATFSGPELLPRGDTYYFSRPDETVPLPVYRVIVQDAERTRYYLDPVSGALVSKADRDARGYRWLHDAFHRIDFAPAVRARPLWDVLMLSLMTGVTAVSATGAYLGLRRLVGMPGDR